jgi:glycosyltransferase involved in cell wall biosynthesis
MKILTVLTYYRPHYSGLTIYAERLTRALAKRGHEAVILTSRFSPELPLQEEMHGVTVRRLPPLMRISKGPLMLTMPFEAWRLVRWADVVSLHTPQLDASYIAWMAKLLGKPVILTYHCDLYLPKGFIHWVANQVLHIANRFAAAGSDIIVSTSRDYAEHSPFLKRNIKKIQVVNVPIELSPADGRDVQAFREKFQIRKGERIIGMAARLATEKGVEVLVRALPQILAKMPNVRVLFVGPYQNVVGEEKYAARIMPSIDSMKDHWSFLGILSPVEMTAFFKVCDVLALPSLNRTEAFGMVQIEAMTCGTPAVASDLPGVRQPILTTGMGKVVPLGDSSALAEALLDILANQEKYRCDTTALAKAYHPETIAEAYERLFAGLLGKTHA